MKKIKLSSEVYFLLSLSIFSIFFYCSCKKSESLPINTKVESEVSIFKSVPVIEKTVYINENDSLFQQFKSVEKVFLTDIDFSNISIKKVVFKGLPDILGLQINFLNDTSSVMDLFFVYESKSKTHLSLFRELSKVSKSNLGTGSIIFKDLSGNELFNDQYFNNKIVVKQDVHNLDILKFGIEKIRSTAIWNCTKTQFDNFYKEAKKTCEEDAFCDFACSFNPCAISYLAFAVGKCTGLIQ